MADGPPALATSRPAAARLDTGEPAAHLARLLAADPDPAYRRRQRVLLGWLAGAGGGPLLDLGCGRGFSLALARAAGMAEPVGLEPDAERLCQAARLGSQSLVRARGERLPFADGAFGRVLASEVLEHVEDDGGVLSEIRRVLRPGGLLALSVPHAEPPASYDPPNALLRRLGRGPIRRGPLAGIWTGHQRLYRSEELRKRVEEAGLEVVELRRLTRATLPFLQLAVYEIGARLLRALPAGVAARLDRSQPGGQGPAGPGWGLTAILALVDRFDAGSDDAGEPPGTPTVNLALLARVPQGAAAEGRF